MFMNFQKFLFFGVSLLFANLLVADNFSEIQNHIKNAAFSESLALIEENVTDPKNGFLLEIEHSLINEGKPTLLRFNKTGTTTRTIAVVIDGENWNFQRTHSVYKTNPNNLGRFFQIYVDSNGYWRFVIGGNTWQSLKVSNNHAFEYSGNSTPTETPLDFPNHTHWRALDGQETTFRISNLFTDESLIYKFISDIGYFYENTLPNYFVENWNFKPTETQNAFNYDPSILRESPQSIFLTNGTEEQVYGAWHYYEDQPFPLYFKGLSLKSAYRAYSAINWDKIKKNAPRFSIYSSNLALPSPQGDSWSTSRDDSAISFTFNSNTAQQINFQFGGGSNSSLDVLINGEYVAQIPAAGNYWSFFYYYDYHNGPDGLYSLSDSTLPIFLLPGDVITFKANIYDSTGYSPYIGFSDTLSQVSTTSPLFEIENGISYLSIPNFGETKTLGDILSIATKETNPSRTLIRSLIDTLDVISPDANVTIPATFTELNYDILIKHEDIMLLKTILELYDVFLSLAGQYNLEIPLDYDVISNMGPYNTAKAFFNDYPQFLETLPERLSDQSDTKSNILSSLSKLEEILPLLFDRGSLNEIDSSYMFTVSDDSDNEDLTDLLSQISTAKSSLNGFVKNSAFTEEDDGGYKISLAPFVSETPLQIRSIINEIEYDPNLNYALYDDDWENEVVRMKSYNLLKKYGFTSDLLPISMDDKVLIFRDGDGNIVSSVLAEDVSYSPYSGKLSDNQGYSIISEDNYYNPIQLSYLSENKGTWTLSNNYTYSNNVFSIIEGSYTWEEAHLDAQSRGGRLAVLNTQEKIDTVNSFLNGFSTWPYLWIGLNTETPNYNWQWIDGSQLTAENWDPSEPSNEYASDGLYGYGFIYMKPFVKGPGLWDDTGGNEPYSYLLEMPSDSGNYNAYSGEFFYYDGSLDLNNNGIADGTEIEDYSEHESNQIDSYILDYPNTLNESLIQTAEAVRIQSAPNSLRGMIFITKEIPSQYDIDMGYYTGYYDEDNFWPYDITYYISEYDCLKLDGSDYEGQGASWEEYYYNNGQIFPLYGYGDIDTLNFQNTYTGMTYSDGDEEKFVSYPSYLDMDGDGLSDGTEVLSGIIPNLTDWPTYNEIQNAINEYEASNNQVGDPIDGANPSPEENPNALADADNDNMPDILETLFGGNSSNANDAQITLSAISNQPEPEQININDVIDLRPGSTVFEIIEGVAYFNIILEESLDLQNWSPYGTTISLQLDDELLSSEAKYYRFRMSD